MNKRKFLVLILILFVSCAPTPIETTLPYATPTQNSVVRLGSNQCLLPCWQKITPGNSTIHELDIVVQDLLGTSLSTKTDIFHGQEYIAASADKTILLDGTKIFFSVGMFSIANHEIVDVITFWADVIGHQEADTSNGHNAYWQLFTTYSLQNTLITYGVPEKVLIFGEVYVEDFLQDRNALHLRLLYPSKGIFIDYDMPMTTDGDKGVACPRNADFELWLTVPNPNNLYMEFWEGAQGYTNFSGTFDTPIEEAIHLTISDFYNQFKVSNDVCFETPLDIWKVNP